MGTLFHKDRNTSIFARQVFPSPSHAHTFARSRATVAAAARRSDWESCVTHLACEYLCVLFPLGESSLPAVRFPDLWNKKDVQLHVHSKLFGRASRFFSSRDTRVRARVAIAPHHTTRTKIAGVVAKQSIYLPVMYSEATVAASSKLVVDPSLITKVTDYVKDFMSYYDPSHDFNHIKRVVHLAHLIQAQTPGTSRDIVTLAALLHDVSGAAYS